MFQVLSLLVEWQYFVVGIENELASTKQQVENLLIEKSQLTEELTTYTQKLNDKDR